MGHWECSSAKTAVLQGRRHDAEALEEWGYSETQKSRPNPDCSLDAQLMQGILKDLNRGTRRSLLVQGPWDSHLNTFQDIWAPSKMTDSWQRKSQRFSGKAERWKKQRERERERKRQARPSKTCHRNLLAWPQLSTAAEESFVACTHAERVRRWPLSEKTDGGLCSVGILWGNCVCWQAQALALIHVATYSLSWDPFEEWHLDIAQRARVYTSKEVSCMMVVDSQGVL